MITKKNKNKNKKRNTKKINNLKKYKKYTKLSGGSPNSIDLNKPSIFLGQLHTGGNDNNSFLYPKGVAVSTNNKIYVVDSFNCRVQVFNGNHNHVDTLGTTGEIGIDNTHFKFPEGIAISLSNWIYVVDSGNNRIQIFDGSDNHKYIGTLGKKSKCKEYKKHKIRKDGWENYNIEFNNPIGVFVSEKNEIYVADSGNNRIQVFTLYEKDNEIKFTLLLTFGKNYKKNINFLDNDNFRYPSSIAIYDDKEVFVVDTFNHRIQIFKFKRNYDETETLTNIEFEYLRTLGSKYDGEPVNALDSYSNNPDIDINLFLSPTFVAISSDNRIFVSDTGNRRICVFNYKDTKFNKNIILNYIDKRTDDRFMVRFWNPSFIAISPAGNDVYISDQIKQCVKVYKGESPPPYEFVPEYRHTNTTTNLISIAHNHPPPYAPNIGPTLRLTLPSNSSTSTI